MLGTSFSTYIIGVAITGTVWSAVCLPRAERWVALLWLGILIEGVAIHLTGWLGVGALWIGAILMMGTVYRHGRARRAG